MTVGADFGGVLGHFGRQVTAAPPQYSRTPLNSRERRALEALRIARAVIREQSEYIIDSMVSSRVAPIRDSIEELEAAR